MLYKVVIPLGIVMHASVQENSLLSLDWHLDAAVFLCSYYPISLSRIFFSYDGIIKYYDALEPFQWLCTCTQNRMKHLISRSQPKYPKTLLLKTYFSTNAEGFDDLSNNFKQ